MTIPAIDIGTKEITTSDNKAFSPNRPRLLYVDNLRILLTILVILHHVAGMYGGIGGSRYREAGQISIIGSSLLLLFQALNQAFFMGFFFMISSYFSPGSVDRKGPWSYLKDRLIRLGIPLMFYSFLISPILNYAYHTNTWKFESIYFQNLWTEAIRYIQTYPVYGIDVGPLWFVAALLFFSTLYVLWRFMLNITNFSFNGDLNFPSRLSITLFAITVGLITFGVRIRLPVGWTFKLLHWQFPHFPQYIALFIVGLLSYRYNWLSGITSEMGWFWSRVALLLILLFPVILILGDGLGDGQARFAGGFHWQSLTYSLWEQFLCMAMVITLLAWFRGRFDRQGALAGSLSAAAYATYIIHTPVYVLFAKSVQNEKMDLLLKFLWVAPVAVVLSFLAGYLIKKLPIARNIL